ncbi:proline-, glutamic acid- and leucine-rich protein 1-like [Liolophura sinensis]|uniref:proline-, glutamic acid- and leucine-rich protein 1-like n=1 Tax=Liolophura sinensis TaxID=3198878 RepID=UPI003158E505
MNLLLQVLQAHCPAAHRHLTCHVVKLLLIESKSLPELAREVSTSFLSQLLPLLLGASEEWAPSSIGCINTCIRQYPGACGVFKGKIESFILLYLDREYPAEILDIWAHMLTRLHTS